MGQDRRPAEAAVVAASMLKLWVLGLRPQRPDKIGYVGSRPGFGV